MKKVLLASTALMLSAGYAAAEVNVTGGANMGVKYTEGAFLIVTPDDPATIADETVTTDNELVLHYEVDFNIVGSGETDGGLAFGASLDVDAGPGAGSVSDPEVFVSGAFGKLTVGDVDSAMDSLSLGFSDVGFDGIGIDDTGEAFIGVGSYNAAYSGSFAGFTIAASMSAPKADAEASEDFSIGAEYAIGDITVAAAYTSVNDGDLDVIAVGAEGSAAGFGYDVFYHQASDNDDLTDDIAGYGASASYGTGPWTFIAAVGATDIDTDEVDFGVGAEYDLGGGATLAGGIGTIDDAFSDDESFIVADFGIKLDF